MLFTATFLIIENMVVVIIWKRENFPANRKVTEILSHMKYQKIKKKGLFSRFYRSRHRHHFVKACTPVLGFERCNELSKKMAVLFLYIFSSLFFSFFAEGVVRTVILWHRGSFPSVSSMSRRRCLEKGRRRKYVVWSSKNASYSTACTFQWIIVGCWWTNERFH